MRAIVYARYGSPEVLELADVDQPVPAHNEVLLRVHASSVNTADWHFLRGKPYLMRLVSGLIRPKRKILGFDVAGRVEVVGKGVTQLQPGDDVFGEIKGGAFAEYVCASEDELALKPANVTFEQAAAVPLSAGAALRGLRGREPLQPGQRVLINGASGAVGTFAVQIGKALGARVTGVCSTRNASMVRSIGADEISDYTREDFTQTGQRWDLIQDLVGSRPLRACLRVLNPNGTYLSSVGRLPWVLKVSLLSPFFGGKATLVPASPNRKDLLFLRELLASGKIKPVIERTLPLSQVPEAIRHQETGHARGKSVIVV